MRIMDFQKMKIRDWVNFARILRCVTKEEAKEWEESWNMCREQVRALSRQSDIISMVLKMDDVELLDLAFGFVRGCYNQQIKKEQEAENNGEM